MSELPVFAQLDGLWINMRSIIALIPTTETTTEIHCAEGHVYAVSMPINGILDELYDTLATIEDADLGAPIACVVADPKVRQP